MNRSRGFSITEPRVQAYAVLLCCALQGGGFAGVRELVIRSDTVVAAPVLVPDSCLLRIMAGVTLRMKEYSAITARGPVIAEGTAAEPILFTAARRPDRGGSIPAWKGVQVATVRGEAVFRHCRFERAFKNIVWECSPVFDSCTFTDNHYALYCVRRAAPHIMNCVFSRNRYAVFADYAMPMLVTSVISGNSVGVVRRLSPDMVEGRNIYFDNETDARTELPRLREGSEPSIQVLWDLLSQLY